MPDNTENDSAKNGGTENRASRNDDTEKGAGSTILIAILIVVVALYAGLFGLQTLVWFEAHRWTSANPWLTSIPQPLPVSTAPAEPIPVPPPASVRAKKSGPAQLQAYTYEFASPWTSISKMVPAENHVDFGFDSGQVIVFFDPEAQVDTLRDLRSTESAQYAQIRAVFAEPFFDSNYDLYNSVYSASPAHTSPFMNSADAMRADVLMLWKLSFGFDLPGPFHSFSFGNNRGFEFGDPASGRPVALRVFDNHEKQFRFIFTSVPGSASVITQDDINTVLRWFQPVPLLER